MLEKYICNQVQWPNQNKYLSLGKLTVKKQIAYINNRINANRSYKQLPSSAESSGKISIIKT